MDGGRRLYNRGRILKLLFCQNISHDNNGILLLTYIIYVKSPSSRRMGTETSRFLVLVKKGYIVCCSAIGITHNISLDRRIIAYSFQRSTNKKSLEFVVLPFIMLQHQYTPFNFLQRTDGVFGLFQWLPFSFVEKLPHFPKYAASPFLLSHPSFFYYPVAWHSFFPVVHLHSHPYRMLRAIATNNLQDVVSLLDGGFPADSQIDPKYGYSPLQIAAINNHYPLIELLLIRGADINRQDRWGNTPLMLAVANQNHEAIHSLLRNGSDLSRKNNYGLTVMDKAQNVPSILEFIRNYAEKKRNFPRFYVRLELQKRLKSPFWDQLLSLKIYSGKVRQNLISKWQFDFTDYRQLSQLILQ